MDFVSGCRVAAPLSRLLRALLAGTALFLPGPVLAQDATWLLNPGSGNFNAGANWTPATVPTGTAFFGLSNTTAILTTADASFDGLNFGVGASAYTITIGNVLTITGAGVVNNSGQIQTLVNNNTLNFTGTSTAGDAAIITSNGNTTDFSGSTGPLGDGKLSAGSIAGAGNYGLGGNELTVGGNRLSTTVIGTISGVGGSLVKTGAGTLTLSGGNTYDGGTTINGGRISISSDSNLGDVAGGLSFNGGGLITTASVASARIVTLNASGGTFDVAAATALTLSGDIAGAGGLTKTGAGELVLTGSNNTYFGATQILEGILTADGASPLSQASDHTVTALATLRIADNAFATVGSLAGAGNVEIGNGATLSTGFNAVAAIFSGALSGDGSLSHEGPGIQVLTGAGSSIGGDLTLCSCVTGQFVLRGGDLAVGGLIDIEAGTLVVEQGAKLTGAGSFLVFGAARISGVGSAVTIANDTAVAGTLTVEQGGALASGGTTLLAGAVLVTGAGSAITTGILAVQSLGFPASLTVAAGGSLTSTGGASIIGLAAPIAALVTGAGSTWTVGGGGLSIGPGAVEATSVTIADGGALVLTSGDLQIAELGTLNIGNGGRAGTLTIAAGAIVLDGRIVADFTDSATIANDILANFTPGSLTKRGAGILTLTGANTFTGGTVLEGGTLSVSSEANLGGLAGALTLNGGVLQITGAAFTQSVRPISFGPAGGGFDIADAANTFTVAQSFSGTGGLSKAGAGTLLLTGTHSYTGSTDVGGGTLQAGAAGAFSPGSAFTIATGATLALNGFSQTIGSLAGGGTVALGAASLSAGGNGSSTTFSGGITGTGGFDKVGTGALTLTGANSYSGGTTVTAGTLVGNSLSLQGAILNNAALVFDQLSAGAYAGALSGTGTLVKQGAGALILTGTSPFTGATSVTAGTLVVNGSLTGSVVTLNGGALGGSGVIGGINAVAGTVAPGNSIGTLNVAGNVAFGPGANYQVELNATGASDRIVATGTALLTGGTVQVFAEQGDYALATRYVILTAQGGVSGQFAGSTSNLAFLTPSLSYGANEVALTLARNDVAFAPPVTTPQGPATQVRFVAQTRNQIGIARVVERLGTGNRIYDTLLFSTFDQARAGFDALSGEGHAQAVTVAVETSHLVRETMLNRLRAPFAATPQGFVSGAFSADAPGRPQPATLPAAGLDSRRFTAWGEAVGAQGRSDADGNAASLSRTTGGMLVGLEYESPSGPAPWRVGVAGGYTRTRFDLDARSTNGSQESGHVGLYGGALVGGFALRGGAALSWNETRLTRLVGLRNLSDLLRSDGRSTTAQAFGEVGYRLPWAGIAFEPFAQLALLSLRTEAVTERGGPAALTLAGRDQMLGFSTLGLRAEAQLGATPIFARAMVGWRHAFGETTPAAVLAFASGSASYRVYAAPLARDAFVAEAGLTWRVAGNAALGLSYAAALSERTRDQTLRGRLDISF